MGHFPSQQKLPVGELKLERTAVHPAMDTHGLPGRRRGMLARHTHPPPPWGEQTNGDTRLANVLIGYCGHSKRPENASKQVWMNFSVRG